MEAHQGGFFYVRAPGMKYTKPPLTVDQQLDQLVRRGMAVADLDAARQHLHHISYYRLRAYWLPDEIPAPTKGEHAFKPGTEFESIVDLYSFDRKLRLLVMDAIERFEVSLRTRWAYVLSTHYGSHGYLEPTVFRDSTEHAKCIDKLHKELERSQEAFVLHYKRTYTNPGLPPFWGICEVLSFGQLSLWFKNIAKGADRAEIVEPYGIDEQIILSFAHHLSYIRNVCAHHSRLWNREMTISMKVPDRPEFLGNAFNTERMKRIYNTLVMLAYMIKVISPGSQWRSHLIALIEEHPKVDLAAMGFPLAWQSSPIWNSP